MAPAKAETGDGALTAFLSKNPVMALLIAAVLGVGGGGGLMALRAPDDVAKAAKTEAKLEDHEKRLTVVEVQNAKLSQDISDMKSDLRVVRLLLERADPKAKSR